MSGPRYGGAIRCPDRPVLPVSAAWTRAPELSLSPRTSSTPTPSSAPTTTGPPTSTTSPSRWCSGRRGTAGSSLDGAFNEAHIIAITAAIIEYRRAQGTDGPLFIGRDTHALSEPAWRTALEVLAAAGVEVHVDARDSWTPTPAVSHAILLHNGAGTSQGVRTSGPGLADGIVVTPSHNPPRDGGFKYNPPHGGPAGSDATGWIADRANELMRSGVGQIRRVGVDAALVADTTRKHDFLSRLRRRPAVRARPRRDPRRPASGSARTRWVAPRSSTGARSPSGTGSTSRSSTPPSTRGGRS